MTEQISQQFDPDATRVIPRYGETEQAEVNGMPDYGLFERVQQELIILATGDGPDYFRLAAEDMNSRAERHARVFTHYDELVAARSELEAQLAACNRNIQTVKTVGLPEAHAGLHEIHEGAAVLLKNKQSSQAGTAVVQQAMIPPEPTTPPQGYHIEPDVQLPSPEQQGVPAERIELQPLGHNSLYQGPKLSRTR